MTLTCETSKPKVDVKWFRDDKEIKVTDKRAKFSKKDAVHTLTIEKVTKDDQAKYSCQIVKNKVKTEGKVTTKGIKPWLIFGMQECFISRMKTLLH